MTAVRRTARSGGPIPVRELHLDVRWRLRAVLREHALFLGGVAAYWLIVLAAGARALTVPLLALLLGASIWGVLAGTDLLASGVERWSRTRLPPSFAGWLRRRTRNPGQALGIVLAASGNFAVILTFGAAKPLIDRLGTYRWDGLFAAWDRALHGGIDPWVFTHALPGGSFPSLLLDRIYLGWFPVMVIACLAAVLADRPALRQQYLLTLLLIWSVAGTALAIAFASGGPVYYEAFTGQPGTFAPLAAELARPGLWAHGLQERLWSVHLAGNGLPFSGISAMPSVHVGAAALVALLAVRLHPALGLAGLLYWLLIMIGSVHLGWHYAVDGYAGTAFALASWWAAGRVARAWLDRPGAAGLGGGIRWLLPRRAAARGSALAVAALLLSGCDAAPPADRAVSPDSAAAVLATDSPAVPTASPLAALASDPPANPPGRAFRFRGPEIVADTFEVRPELRGGRLTLVLDTDLGDATEVFVSIARSYRIAGSSEEYLIEYFNEAGTVGTWRAGKTVDLASTDFLAEVVKLQGAMATQWEPFAVSSVSDELRVAFRVYPGQDAPFVRGNANLAGKAVSISQGNRVIEKDLLVRYPLGSIASRRREPPE